MEVESIICGINDVEVSWTQDPDLCKNRSDRDKSTIITLPDGATVRPTARFWTSFSSLFNQNRSIFNLFSYDEVFNRIAEKRSKSRIRVTYEVGTRRLLGCTSPNRPIFNVNDSHIFDNAINGHKYCDGLLTGIFKCQYGDNYTIGGDVREPGFLLEIPVDGYGLPRIYLSSIMSNIAIVGYCKKFKSLIKLDTQPVEEVTRSFNNERGYDDLHASLDCGYTSWVSYNEACNLFDTIGRVITANNLPRRISTEIYDRFENICGDPLSKYGISDRTEVSDRIASTVPMDCSVYDLLKFSAELANSCNSNHDIYNFMGRMIGGGYDLGGIMDN